MIREVREVAGLGGVKAAMRCVIGRVEEFVVAAFAHAWIKWLMKNMYRDIASNGIDTIGA